MQILIVGASGLPLAAAIVVAAQTNPLSKGPAYFHSNQSLEQKGAAMLPDAAKSDGLGMQRFETYPGSYTQLTVRTASGGGELHQRWEDNFFVVSGEATVIIGGHVVDPKEASPGEIRGTRVEGGESHILRKGDVLHIAADTPHQTILAPGQTFVYYVIKVEEPAAHLMPATK
jgi:mannose-6-phosphate isomerase-like protein (cupin superfamily)